MNKLSLLEPAVFCLNVKNILILRWCHQSEQLLEEAFMYTTIMAIYGHACLAHTYCMNFLTLPSDPPKFNFYTLMCCLFVVTVCACIIKLTITIQKMITVLPLMTLEKNLMFVKLSIPFKTQPSKLFNFFLRSASLVP